MEQAEIIINTSMTKEDYKKFLYIATFRRNKLVIPMLILISLVGGVIIGLNNGYFDVIKFIISWILLFGLSIGVILFKIQRKNARRIKTDKTGTFDSVNTLKFFKDKIVMENKSINSTAELDYDKFFSLMETKDYFIFYFTGNQAALIRKQDIGDLKVFEDFIIAKFEDRYKQI